MTTSHFIDDSIKRIKASQAATGAYMASPAFAHYRYSWLRDGAFIAYAMNRVGEHESARRFYEWCHFVLLRHEQKAREIIQKVTAQAADIHPNQFLHARYTVDGDEVEGEWGNFQLDGYGTWLWGLGQYVQLTGDLKAIASFRQAIELTIDYLLACWRLPNYDCWEELGTDVHPVTLAAIYAGLAGISNYLPERRAQLDLACEEIRNFVLNQGRMDGYFVKSVGATEVDASLLWIALPFQLVEVHDPGMVQTVRIIEQKLVHAGGVHRYAQDTYYGGGQWILLSAWLGWYYLRLGERKKAEGILAWIESKYSAEGLPEQVQDHLLAPEQYEPWVKQSGNPACPLLWSHAMYLVLAKEAGR